jgi:hypothetical protein
MVTSGCLFIKRTSSVAGRGQRGGEGERGDEDSEEDKDSEEDEDYEEDEDMEEDEAMLIDVPDKVETFRFVELNIADRLERRILASMRYIGAEKRATCCR